MKFENVLTGFLVFGFFITIFQFNYANLQSDYGFETTGGANNTLELLREITVLDAVEDLKQVMYELDDYNTPSSTVLTAFVVFTGAGISILKIGLGIIILPMDIIKVISLYFSLPYAIAYILGVIAQVYILFMLYNSLKGN
jgi:hypothetical protein